MHTIHVIHDIVFITIILCTHPHRVSLDTDCNYYFVGQLTDDFAHRSNSLCLIVEPLWIHLLWCVCYYCCRGLMVIVFLCLTMFNSLYAHVWIIVESLLDLIGSLLVHSWFTVMDCWPTIVVKVILLCFIHKL